MNKNLILITIILLVAISIVVRILFFKQDEEIIIPVIEDNENTANTGMSFSTSSLVASRNGLEDVTVRDFLKDSDIEQYDENTFRIAKENSVEGIPWYEIYYFNKDRTIVVSLQTTPLSIARTLAERELLTKLSVPEIQLCSLEIRVSVPQNVDPKLSGRNLGLSMCPNAMDL